MGTTELISRLSTELSQRLLSESPDLDAVEAGLVSDGDLSPEEARQLVYEIVRRINAALYPPLNSLELVLTQRCNLACSYCFEGDALGAGTMSEEVGRAAIDLLFDYARDEPRLTITHFGGEPTLCFELMRTLTEYAEDRAAAKGVELEFGMTTNGLLLDEPMVAYLAEHRVKALLSIDGLAATHDRYRRDHRGRGSYARVIEGLRRLKVVQPWVGAKMTVMPSEAHRLYDNVLGLYALGVNQFIIGHATGLIWSEAEMAAYEQGLRRLWRWYHADPRPKARIGEFDEPDERTGYYGCQAGRNSISVAANGDVLACSKLLSCYHQQPAMLGTVWHGLTHARNRLELMTCDRVRAACEERGLGDTYRGGCYAANLEDCGDLYTPSLQEQRFAEIWARLSQEQDA
jgi:uncharacterized protein